MAFVKILFELWREKNKDKPYDISNVIFNFADDHSPFAGEVHMTAGEKVYYGSWQQFTGELDNDIIFLVELIKTMHKHINPLKLAKFQDSAPSITLLLRNKELVSRFENLKLLNEAIEIYHLTYYTNETVI